MSQLSLIEAAEELRRQAYALSKFEPMPIEILKDLVATSDRIKKHADHLVGWRAELTGILHQLDKLGTATSPRPVSKDPVEEWRLVALEFHCIQDCLRQKLLYQGFEPMHLARLRKNSAALTPSGRGVLAFLLHIYNSANRFDLAEVQRWDDSHRAAFQRWVSGQSTGEPCRYF
jgi:hypothetical protein